MSKKTNRLRCFLLLVPALGGCSSFGNTEAGALVGTGLGATTGAIIGSESGHAGGGALIGAAAGAVAGGLAGNAVDAREERDAAVAQAQYHQAQAQAAQQAMTSSDVIDMVHAQVSDDVIISTLRSRGCRFSNDPQSIIQLKGQGVSDRVIQAMQSSPSGAYAGSTPPVIYAGPRAAPPAVIVTPPPPYYGWGPRRYWGPPPPYYRPRYYW